MRNTGVSENSRNHTGNTKPSIFEKFQNLVRARVAGLFLASTAAVGLGVSMEAKANTNTCLSSDGLLEEIRKIGSTPSKIPQNTQSLPAILTYKVDLEKELRESTAVFDVSLDKRIVSIKTPQGGSLNIRSDAGLVSSSIPSGKKIVLSGEKKQTKVWTYVKIKSWANNRSLSGWVSLNYLLLEWIQKEEISATFSLQKPEVKSEQKSKVVTKEIAKKTTQKTTETTQKTPTTSKKIAVAELTEEDRNQFKSVRDLLARKASILSLNIDSFKDAISKNEWSGSYAQSNQKLAEKLWIPADKVADGRYQFIPSTRYSVNREFFGKPHSGLRGMFLKHGELQEAFMDGLMIMNINSLQSDSFLRKAIEDKKVSPTFVLSAMHYSGISWAKSAVTAALNGKKLTGQTDWIGKTDIFTYAATADANYNKQVAALETNKVANNSKNPDSVETTVKKVAYSPDVSQEAPTAKIISLAEASKKRNSVLSEQAEKYVRGRLASKIYRKQDELIALKVKYKAAWDLGRIQAVNEYLIASQRRLNAAENTESVPKYYKTTIAILENEVAQAPNAVIKAKKTDILAMAKEEYSYVVSLAREVSKGNMPFEKPAFMVRNDTIYAIDSVMRKAA